MLPIRTILHPTDFSENSALAFRLACSLAKDYGARLIVLHVQEPPLVLYGEGVMPYPVEGTREELRAELQKMKPASPGIPVEHRLVEGLGAEEILKAAEETKCDVILMGTHGRTGLNRLLMGSLAEEIVRKAPCPVVTVRAPLAQLQPSLKAAEKAEPHAAVKA